MGFAMDDQLETCVVHASGHGEKPEKNEKKGVVCTVLKEELLLHV